MASCAALLVCLSKALVLLKISSGSEIGVAGGLLGFSLVLGLLEATLFQWSLHINDYNQNSVQTLSIIKVGSMSSPREARFQSPLLNNGTSLLALKETPQVVARGIILHIDLGTNNQSHQEMINK